VSSQTTKISKHAARHWPAPGLAGHQSGRVFCCAASHVSWEGVFSWTLVRSSCVATYLMTRQRYLTGRLMTETNLPIANSFITAVHCSRLRKVNADPRRARSKHFGEAQRIYRSWLTARQRESRKAQTRLPLFLWRAFPASKRSQSTSDTAQFDPWTNQYAVLAIPKKRRMRRTKAPLHVPSFSNSADQDEEYLDWRLARMQ
jgi:hypothetical protein